MARTADLERYVKNPDVLFALIREVIGCIDSEDDKNKFANMEAQLREISRTVEKLEKLGVPVLDVLRAEKTRLAAALSIQSDSVIALNHFADGLEEITKELKARLGRETETNSQ